MYFNDVHILIYVVFFIIGAIVGQFVEWMNTRIIENKKIFSKEIKQSLKGKIKINYFSVITIAVLYTIILHKFGIKNNLLENIELMKYIVLIPMLISIIIIDYKKRIIPNRLVLTILESGIIFTFLYGLNNLFVTRNFFIGAILGFVIFGVIALLGKLIAGREAMGMGDIKLIATLGLYFGTALTISISIISFVIAAIVSIAMMFSKKKTGEYITFGPYIGISAIICIIVPEEIIISVLLTIFTLGRYKI